MNGVAKQFWSEVYDLHAPVDDGAPRSRTSRGKSKKKAARKVRTSQKSRRAA